MRVEPEILLTKFRAAAVWAAVRISPRCASAAFRGALDLDERSGDVAQQSNCDLAVEKNVFDELCDVGVAAIDGKADERRIPNAPGLTQLVGLPPRIEGIRLHSRSRSWTLRDGSQTGWGTFAPSDKVELVVENEQVLGRCDRGVRGRFEHIDRR